MLDVISSMVRPAVVGAAIIKVTATREKSGVRVISGQAVAICCAVPVGAFSGRIRCTGDRKASGGELAAASGHWSPCAEDALRAW